MSDVPHHRQAALYPNAWVTLGLLYALRGVGVRPFLSVVLGP